MQKWDYYVLSCLGLYLEEMDVKKGSKKARYPLDLALEWELGITRVAWSDKGQYWTKLWKCLAEIGEEGWELVGTTPPMSLPAGGGPYRVASEQSEFYLLFKRLRG